MPPLLRSIRDNLAAQAVEPDGKWGGLEPYNAAILVYDRVHMHVERFSKDPRLAKPGNTTLVQALVEEFVHSILGSMKNKQFADNWVSKVNLLAPLVQAVYDAFGGS